MTKQRLQRIAVVTGVIASLALVALPLSAQRGGNSGARGDAQLRRGGGVEALLSMREQLDLSEDQIGRLNGLRLARLEQQSARLIESMRVRSDVAAGELTRVEARDRMSETRESRASDREAAQDEVNSILTLEQREKVLELRQQRMRRGSRARGARGRPGVRGRRGAVRPG